MIQRMMEAQPTDSHNEVVLDASNWVANLPHTIEAFFAVRWPDDLIASPTLHYQRAENQNVHQKHREFLEKYGADDFFVQKLGGVLHVCSVDVAAMSDITAIALKAIYNKHRGL